MYGEIITTEEINTIILHTPGKMFKGKNLNAINKIIKEMSYRDLWQQQENLPEKLMVIH